MTNEQALSTTAPARARRIPPGLIPVLALIALDLVIRQAAWWWWPWPAGEPGEPVSRHLPLDGAAIALWAVSFVEAAWRKPRWVFSPYAEGEPSSLRIGVIVVLVVSILATLVTLAEALLRPVLGSGF